MATLHSVPLRFFPSDWESETYSDSTFLALIAPHAINSPLTDEEVSEMESVTDYGDGEYPAAILSRTIPPMLPGFLFLVTDGEAFPTSAGEIRSNLSFPVLDNFCYDASLLKARIENLDRAADRARAMLESLK
jgi:hypothetical protein